MRRLAGSALGTHAYAPDGYASLAAGLGCMFACLTVFIWCGDFDLGFFWGHSHLEQAARAVV